jgi:hypothetical protein
MWILLLLAMEIYTMDPLGITVSPYHLARHIVIMITRILEYITRKENETETRGNYVIEG